MTVRYVINTLKPGVDPAAYEKWLREYDYRVATRSSTIRLCEGVQPIGS